MLHSFLRPSLTHHRARCGNWTWCLRHHHSALQARSAAGGLLAAAPQPGTVAARGLGHAPRLLLDMASQAPSMPFRYCTRRLHLSHGAARGAGAQERADRAAAVGAAVRAAALRASDAAGRGRRLAAAAGDRVQQHRPAQRPQVRARAIGLGFKVRYSLPYAGTARGLVVQAASPA